MEKCRTNIPYDSYILLKISIHNFFNFKNVFEGGADPIFVSIMQDTAQELIKELNGTSFHIHDGEIYLTIPPRFSIRNVISDKPVFNSIAIERSSNKEFKVNENALSQYPVLRDYFYSPTDYNLEIVKKSFYFYREEVKNFQIFEGRIDLISSFVSGFATKHFNRMLLKKTTDVKNYLEKDQSYFKNLFSVFGNISFVVEVSS